MFCFALWDKVRDSQRLETDLRRPGPPVNSASPSDPLKIAINILKCFNIR